MHKKHSFTYTYTHTVLLYVLYCMYLLNTDIDECQNSNGMCEQICMDTDGSYLCNCREGYVQLEGNPLLCRGI